MNSFSRSKLEHSEFDTGSVYIYIYIYADIPETDTFVDLQKCQEKHPLS